MVLPITIQKRHLFQVNRHVQASIMLLSVMDGAEIDLTNSSLSTTNPSSKTNSATSSLSATDDYEKGSFSRKLNENCSNETNRFVLFFFLRFTTRSRTRSLFTRTKSRTSKLHKCSSKTSRRRTKRHKSMQQRNSLNVLNHLN